MSISNDCMNTSFDDEKEKYNSNHMPERTNAGLDNLQPMNAFTSFEEIWS
jgi:hypothetical protein